MIYISHRGNIDGRIESSENDPAYIDLTISKGYDVEIDVWCKNGILWLGHDNPDYAIEFGWLVDRKERLWVHCKNLEAIFFFKENVSEINFFWHQTDDITITSKGFLWTYPGKAISRYSIAVMPEIESFEGLEQAHGICSDFISNYNKKKTSI